jgi:hypothetical protein
VASVDPPTTRAGDSPVVGAGRSHAELERLACDFAVDEAGVADQGRARVTGIDRGLSRVDGERGTGLFLGAEMVAPRREHPARLSARAVQARLDAATMPAMPCYHPVVEEGLRAALRDLDAELRLRPPAPPRSIDRGPGGGTGERIGWWNRTHRRALADPRVTARPPATSAPRRWSLAMRAAPSPSAIGRPILIDPAARRAA